MMIFFLYSVVFWKAIFSPFLWFFISFSVQCFHLKKNLLIIFIDRTFFKNRFYLEDYHILLTYSGWHFEQYPE